MAIIGQNIMSMSASKKILAAANIDISSTPKILDVREKSMEVPNLSDKVEVLGIEFEFITEYKPDVGTIKIAGELIYSGDNKKIVKEWKKGKTLPQDVDIEVKNFLLRKCLLMGMNISQELQLPPPLSIPFIRLKEKEDKKSPDYIG